MERLRIIAYMEPKPPKTRATLREAAAFSVHIFTACGAACALLALVAAVGAAWTQMFVWLGVAVIIDGIDGTFARRLRVAEVLPRWSGDLLDFVVDYATYVFVPAYAIVAGGLLPPSVALALGLIVTVTGALYFADRRMKTSRQLLPRLSGAVERGRVLSLRTQARALARCRRDCRAGGGNVCPDPFCPSGACAAMASSQHGSIGALGIACGFRAGAKTSIRRLGRGGARGDCPLFRDRRADAPRDLITCAASTTTYDRALAKDCDRRGKW